MRERVALLYGEFSAGPRPEGGFRVAARLPLPRPRSQPAGGAVTIRVLLADDQPLIRAGCAMLIGDTRTSRWSARPATGAEAVRLVRQPRPDVVVMDIRMPGMDGIEATRLITAEPDPPRVLVLTTFDDDDYVYGALRAGASGFLVKDMALDDILAAIRVVAAGDALIAPSVTRRLIADFAAAPAPAPARTPGPPRESRGHRPGARGAGTGRTRPVQR